MPMETQNKENRLPLEQRRARHAWEKAKEGIQAEAEQECKKGEYANIAKALPALIMNSGLMQVMAFCQDEKRKCHQMVALHLRQWLHNQFNTPIEFEDFMEELMQADAAKFQRINAEAMAWLKWLRQMAAARQGG